MASPVTRSRVHRTPRLAALAAVPLLLAGLSTAHGADAEPAGEPIAPLIDDSPRELVEVVVEDRQGVLDLISAGADVTEYARPVADGVEVHVVAGAGEQDRLRDLGFDVGETVVAAEEVAATVAEREAAVRRLDTMSARAADTLTVLRSEWFESDGRTYLNVEVKTSAGEDSSTVLTISVNGRTYTLDRFADAGEYLYHRFSRPIPVDEVPDQVTITSSMGGETTAQVDRWLGEPRPPEGPHYATGFVDHYMDPTEVYERIEALAAEFPDLAEIVELPYETNGYRRHAQALIGDVTANTFYVTSKAWGHEGGNDLVVETLDPGTADSPLGVTVDGDTVTVSLGTDGDGNPASTAAEVVEAINTTPEASALMTASTYRGDDGDGVAVADRRHLSDSLDAPDSISREPFTVRAIRIGSDRDGSKTGVLAYSQEHAREWVTPLVAVETAERLLRNYRQDAATRKLVDGLDIFIIPSVNPDGGHYSFYDENFQRKNMTNHCGAQYGDPNASTAWGVDINRNFSVGSRHDGYVGASGLCVSGVYSGPSELSEPEARNEVWLTEQFPNIDFAMNVHSYGGYFMWPPGAYVADGRTPLERPTPGEEEYFWTASRHILSAVHSWRGTAVWPGRTGPVIDVLYSAAGNSADEHWYEKGIYGWDFEVGADIWDPEEGEWDSVGFQPPFAEGYQEAMEFSSGLIGLFEVARAHGTDVRPPRTTLELTDDGVVFDSTEPVTVHYTLDGSRPTYDSPMVRSAGLREGAAPVPVGTGTTRVHWFSVDAAGNVENRYDPDGHGRNYRRDTVTVE
ncbi:chitobiase/beta-hexosaminidase-like protein [Haloactinopolyspora alba]|uniref:Chitobiase/beta-hexosaminidase-like protein n=1 Tax=Haloactinopolyspora alba TaxID=648780 RepID=A0A2P8E5L7_9ACTN|nr:M14 family metallopeptidase [Haloactinopolyspora alba]PSL04759.1 chitobiase/beta-hexosaminidase-like protein [Haloactinopolyspora alba]